MSQENILARPEVTAPSQCRFLSLAWLGSLALLSLGSMGAVFKFL
jgi:hypothetical protein